MSCVPTSRCCFHEGISRKSSRISSRPPLASSVHRKDGIHMDSKYQCSFQFFHNEELLARRAVALLLVACANKTREAVVAMSRHSRALLGYNQAAVRGAHPKADERNRTICTDSPLRFLSSLEAFKRSRNRQYAPFD